LIAENEAAQKTTTSTSARCADVVLRPRGMAVSIHEL
jgi:hypothetical protein